MRSSLLIVVFSLLTQGLLAQVEFRTKVSQREVRVGQKFQVEFTVNQEGRGFRPPSFPGFEVLDGPNYAVNTFRDNRGTRFQLSYGYILRAKEVGEYTIDPAFIRVESKTYRTEPVKIKVVKKKSTAQSRNRERIFLKAIVSDNEVYEGEPIFAKYRLFYRVDLFQHQFTEEPDFQGFYKEEIEQNQIQRESEYLDGQQYYAADLRKLVIIPQKAGTYSPGNVALSAPIRYNTGQRDYFGFPIRNTKKVDLSESFPTIKVKPLPDKGRPQNFSGAVGQYKLNTEISTTELNTDGSISLKIRLEGKGNIKLADLPKVEFPSAFEVFDPEIKERSKVGAFGMEGYKEIEYLLVPRYSGTYKIDPVQFSYFDPRKKKYIRLESEPFEITVNGENGAAPAQRSAPRAANAEREAVDFINKDILFIKTQAGKWNKHGSSFLGSQLFWIILAAILLMAVGLILWWLRIRSELENRDSLRIQRAAKAARKKLRNAKKALKGEDPERFYQELEVAIYGFFSDKLNVGKSQMNKEFLEERLNTAAASKENIEALIKLLEKCEMARYTGLKIDAAAQDFEHAGELLTEIDKQL